RRPLVHLARNLLGDSHEPLVAMDRELEVALVVERHRPDLAQRILAVEHPPVRAAQEGISNVGKADLDRAARTGGWPGPLDPLALQVARDLGADEVALARVFDFDRRAGNDAVRIQETDTLAPAGTISAR